MTITSQANQTTERKQTETSPVTILKANKQWLVQCGDKVYQALNQKDAETLANHIKWLSTDTTFPIFT